MIRFYGLEPGVLAGCSRPGARPGRHAAAEEEIASDLAALRGHGIGALLSLTETPLPTAALEGAGIATLHLPVPDFHPPSPEQLALALRFIDEHRACGEAVAVHCLAGQGRTGSVLAAWLIRGGLEARPPSRHLPRRGRSRRPGAGAGGLGAGTPLAHLTGPASPDGRPRDHSRGSSASRRCPVPAAGDQVCH